MGLMICIVENCIVTMDPTATKTVSGIGIGNEANPDADRNNICGNIVYGITHNSYYISSNGGHHIMNNNHVNNVAITNNSTGAGLSQSADGNWKGDKFTVIGTPQY